jgi:RND family efflux transporter MFP subunit
MNKKALLIAAGLIALAAGGWFGVSILYPVVRVEAAVTGPAVRAIYATGVVEPIRWAKVGSTMAGRIVEMAAKEGETVKTGRVLVKLDDRDARASVDEIKARLTYLETQMRRVAKLRATGTLSGQAYDVAQSELNQARAALDVAQLHVAHHSIKSPLDGVVLRKDGEPGETIAAGQILYWVGETAPLWIVTDIDEDDIPLLAVGQTSLIRADAFPGQVISGKVAEITPMGDPINRVYRARIGLPDDSGFRIGMTTEINVVVSERPDAVLAPLNALRDGRMFVVEDGVARARKVVTGVTTADRVEILEGVKSGALVVLDAPRRLKDGDRVRTRLIETPAGN